MLADIGVGIFIAFYFILVVGSMALLSYAWYKDRKRSRRPKLRLIKRDDD